MEGRGQDTDEAQEKEKRIGPSVAPGEAKEEGPRGGDRGGTAGPPEPDSLRRLGRGWAHHS